MNQIIAEILMRLRMSREDIISSADPPPPTPAKKTTLSNLICAHTYMNFHPCPLFRLALEASSLLWKTPASVESRLYPWAYIFVRYIERAKLEIQGAVDKRAIEIFGSYIKSRTSKFPRVLYPLCTCIYY